MIKLHFYLVSFSTFFQGYVLILQCIFVFELFRKNTKKYIVPKKCTCCFFKNTFFFTFFSPPFQNPIIANDTEVAERWTKYIQLPHCQMNDFKKRKGKKPRNFFQLLLRDSIFSVVCKSNMKIWFSTWRYFRIISFFLPNKKPTSSH